MSADEEEGLSLEVAEPHHQFITLLCADGSVERVEREIAFSSPFLRDQILIGDTATLVLPKQVTLESLRMINEWQLFHRADGRSDKERRLYDERFSKLDTRRLCALTSAADALGLKDLVDLVSRSLARCIEGKTPEQASLAVCQRPPLAALEAFARSLLFGSLLLSCV